MPFLPPNQQRQSTEGNFKITLMKKEYLSDYIKIRLLSVHAQQMLNFMLVLFIIFPFAVPRSSLSWLS